MELIISLIVIAGIVFFIYNFSGETGETVIISKDNKIIETLSLFEDKIIDIGSNTIEIKGLNIKWVFLPFDDVNKFFIGFKESEI